MWEKYILSTGNSLSKHLLNASSYVDSREDLYWGWGEHIRSLREYITKQ